MSQSHQIIYYIESEPDSIHFISNSPRGDGNVGDAGHDGRARVVVEDGVVEHHVALLLLLRVRAPRPAGPFHERVVAEGFLGVGDLRLHVHDLVFFYHELVAEPLHELLGFAVGALRRRPPRLHARDALLLLQRRPQRLLPLELLRRRVLLALAVGPVDALYLDGRAVLHAVQQVLQRAPPLLLQDLCLLENEGMFMFVCSFVCSFVRLFVLGYWI